MPSVRVLVQRPQLNQVTDGSRVGDVSGAAWPRSPRRRRSNSAESTTRRNELACAAGHGRAAAHVATVHHHIPAAGQRMFAPTTCAV